MLDIVAPQSEKNLAALDSVYVKCGIENFRELKELVSYVCVEKLSREFIHDLIHRYEEYLKNGLQAHLSDISDCKTH